MRSSIILACHLCWVIAANAQKQGQELLDSLLTELENAEQDTNGVNLLNKISAACFRVGAYERARDYAQQALEQADTLNWGKGAAYALMNIGRTDINVGNYADALNNCSNSLARFEELGDEIGLAEVRNVLGIYYEYQANYEEALKNHMLSMELKERLGDRRGMADSYGNMGGVYFKHGRYEESLKALSAALKIYQETGDQRGIGGAQGNMGAVYRSQGNYPLALEKYLAALKVQEKLDDKRGVANSYNGIGNLYRLIGDYNEALRNHRASLRIRQEIGNRSGAAISYGSIANVLADQRDFPGAIENHLAGLKIQEELSNKHGIAASRHNIGLVQAMQGMHAGALKDYFASLKIRESISDTAGIVMCCINIGRSYMAMGDFGKAAEWIKKGLALGERIGSLGDLKVGYEALAEATSAIGDHRAAFEHYKMFILYRDSLFNEENTKKLVRSQMQYEFDKKEAVAKAEQEKKDALATEILRRRALQRNASIGGGALLLLGGLFANRVDRKRRKAHADRRTTELEIKALRAQMNPHFLFNALNSIHDHILENEAEVAADYLAKFSKLMRQVLESSRLNEVPLARELDILRGYIELERMRLRGKFEVVVEVAPEVDHQNTTVPPLILQPFVENAIWHGLSRKEGKGLLRIEVKQRNDALVVAIQDDGVGRATPKTTAGSDEGKTSLGTTITRDRLELLATQRGAHAGFEFVPVAEGTRVEVVLPLAS